MVAERITHYRASGRVRAPGGFGNLLVSSPVMYRVTASQIPVHMEAEITDKPVGELCSGETVVVYESVKLASGQVRLRCEAGWVSQFSRSVSKPLNLEKVETTFSVRAQSAGIP